MHGFPAERLPASPAGGRSASAAADPTHAAEATTSTSPSTDTSPTTTTKTTTVCAGSGPSSSSFSIPGSIPGSCSEPQQQKRRQQQ